jgi:hypothetical protein
MTRNCDRCGAHMAPGSPRRRVGDQMLCPACVLKPRGGYVSAALSFEEHLLAMKTDSMRSSGRKVTAMRKQAHDSGDGETIYHCPFCGSGQVIARSDRTIECEFCHTCFTVQVQPEFSAFPQTINGMPVQVPGMPGQMGVDPMAGGGVDPATGMPTDPSMDPNAAMAGGVPESPDSVPNIPPGDGGDPAEEEGDPEKDEKKKDNPFTSGLRGTTSQIMATEDYLAHLALVHSGDRNRTLAMIHKRRNRRG